MTESTDKAYADQPVSPTPSKYFEKATDQIAHYDRLMVTIYSGLIAGISVLLLKHEVSSSVGAVMLVALGMFVLGIGHTLLHINFHNKVLMLLEALANGREEVPNMTKGSEPTVAAYQRIQLYAQRAYVGQLVFLFLGVAIAATAVVLRVWQSDGWAGVIVAGVVAVVFGATLTLRLWAKAIMAHARCGTR